MLIHVLAGTNAEKDININIRKNLGMINSVNELEYLYNLRDKVLTVFEKFNKGRIPPYIRLSTDEIDYLIDVVEIDAEYIFNVSEPVNTNLMDITPTQIEDWDIHGAYSNIDYINSIRAKSLRIILDGIDKRIANIDKVNLNGVGAGDPRGFPLALKQYKEESSWIPIILLVILGSILVYKGTKKVNNSNGNLFNK